VLNLSGSQLVVVLVVTLALAYLGYSLAEADRRNLGRSPWGVPSAGWAAIWFFSPLLGFVLWFIAHRAEVRRAAQAPFVPVGGPPAAPPPAAASASDFPAYPRRADGGARDVPSAAPPPVTEGSPPGTPGHPTGTPHPVAGAPGPVAGVPGPVAGAPGPVAGAPGPVAGVEHHLSPPAWHPDPSGRFHYRWWTGSEWTSYVSVHGRVEVDTNPDQRIGPY